VKVVKGAAGAVKGVGGGVVEGFRVGEEEIVVGTEVAIGLSVGFVVDVLVIVGWVEVVEVESVLEVVDVESVLEVVGAGVAEVMAMTTAVGVSEVVGGVVLVVGFGPWTGWKGSP